MAINWTNNGTSNKWNVGDTATFTATGDLPDWIKNGQFNTSVFYVTSDGTTAAATATGDGVTYSGGVLTLTMSINLDINDWTVQVYGTNSSNVLRWPGFGAVSDPWADPGCQADDAESGDLTHLITRTYEKQQLDDSWSTVDKIDQVARGTYKTTYNVSDSTLDATPVTRVVIISEPAPGVTEDFYAPIAPGEDPPVGVRPPVLNRVEMTGEGGYSPLSYMYQNVDTVYAIKEADDMISTSKSVSSGYATSKNDETSLWNMKSDMVPTDRLGDDLKITREDGNTVTFATIPNCIRLASSNLNSCVMFRDGVVSTGGGTLYGSNISQTNNTYSWLADNWMNIVDMFMPSSYTDDALPELAIMKDGSLVGLNLSNPKAMSNPPTILTNMRRIRAINQGHTCDMICETNDGTLYYVYGYGPAEHPKKWRVEEIKTLGNINGDDIHLMSLGDYAGTCRVVLHGEPNKTRQIYSSRTLNGAAAVPSGLGSPVTYDENLLDITANELGFTYATESKVHFTSYLAHKSISSDTSNWGEYIRTVGSTAYAVIHKYTTGYYVGIEPYFGGTEFEKSENMTALEKYIIENQ